MTIVTLSLLLLLASRTSISKSIALEATLYQSTFPMNLIAMSCRNGFRPTVVSTALPQRTRSNKNTSIVDMISTC